MLRVTPEPPECVPAGLVVSELDLLGFLEGELADSLLFALVSHHA